MQKSSLESPLLYLGFACMAGSLFRASLGLPLWSEFVFGGAALGCFVGVFAVRRSQRTPPSASQPRTVQPLGIRLLSLFLIIAVSAAAPWWLPYTGVTLDFATRVVVAVLSGVGGVTILLLAWWHAARKA
jgi:hypothetical protein